MGLSLTQTTHEAEDRGQWRREPTGGCPSVILYRHDTEASKQQIDTSYTTYLG